MLELEIECMESHYLIGVDDHHSRIFPYALCRYSVSFILHKSSFVRRHEKNRGQLICNYRAIKLSFLL